MINHLIKLIKLLYGSFKSRIKKNLIYAGMLALISIIVKLYQKEYKLQKSMISTMNKFLKELEKNQIISVFIEPKKLYYKTIYQTKHITDHSLLPNNILFQELKKANVDFQYSSEQNKWFLLLIVVLSAIITFWLIKDKSSSIDNVSKKPQKNIKLDQIVGLDQAKIVIKQAIGHINNPQQYKKLGVRKRKGLILYGPPGTGKTTLAKACANEAQIPFFVSNASQFCQIYVGMGAKKVRQLFARARQNSPCIVFIDEIDAIGNRNQFHGDSSSQRNSTINQLLSEMDGFNSNEQVFVMASTNKIQMLDLALLRPGRFDLKLQIKLPNEKYRLLMLKQYLKNKKHQLDQQYLSSISLRTNGLSGADIENLINQSAYQALRNNNQFINNEHLQISLNKIKL